MSTEANKEYEEYSLKYYGQAVLTNKVMHDYADAVLHRLTHMEEYQRKEAEYWASPEGQAKKEEQRLAQEKRDNFKKRYQHIHDWLTENGCECNHDDCY